MTYNSSMEEEKLENKQFELVKELTVLAGSVFGLSIALAAGREVNARFILGELLLFISVFSGVVLLYSALKGKEFFHYMMTSSDLKLNLPKRTGGKEDFIVDAQEDLLNRYEKLMEKSKGGLFTFILRIIKVDYFYPIFLTTFLLGIFFIFLSLVNLYKFFSQILDKVYAFL